MQKITVGTIQEQYYKRAPIDFFLTLVDQIPEKNQKLSEINYYGDNFVIFRALEVNSAAARALLWQAQQTDSQNGSMANSVHDAVNGSQDSSTDASNIPEMRAEYSTNGFAAPPSSYTPPFTKQEFSPEKSRYISENPGPMYSNVSMYGLPTPHQDKADPHDTRSAFFDPNVSMDVNMQTPEPTSMPGPRRLFNKHRSPEKRKFAETTYTGNMLQKLTKETSPEMLEEGVKTGLGLLDQINASFAPQAALNPEVASWHRQIVALQAETKATRTVVGVVGNTGAGKSSVINALLDEERLVPTNCMRACTAVVTELSWNNSEGESEKYRAEIEFIQPDEWQKELETLYKDLLDSNGEISRECTNVESEAGVAYAKMRAVYPQHTKDMLAGSSIQSLMNATGVKKVLGTTVNINKGEPESFYRGLQHYVDSKEKNTAPEKGGPAKKDKPMEFWPLIKVVRIYTKAAALSTGAVLVGKSCLYLLVKHSSICSNTLSSRLKRRPLTSAIQTCPVFRTPMPPVLPSLKAT